ANEKLDKYGGGNIVTDLDEKRLIIYKELCNSYRAIDNFRAKLLGFLQLATGGVFLLYSGEKIQERT
ncbi:MAG: hypothetical protein JXL81_07880, partial [Deltaproteobacteria bacterium]|nr:hypothetical protein [Deltaproteobacteria bacterium]